jgi:hypothetical protein
VILFPLYLQWYIYLNLTNKLYYSNVETLNIPWEVEVVWKIVHNMILIESTLFPLKTTKFWRVKNLFCLDKTFGRKKNFLVIFALCFVSEKFSCCLQRGNNAMFTNITFWPLVFCFWVGIFRKKMQWLVTKKSRWK